MASHPVTHGGRALAFAREHNIDYRAVLDFSANVNPLGPSPKAIDAIKQALDMVCIYPDENSIRLRSCLSHRLRVPPEMIIIGNGATELLYFWLRTIRPRTATLLVPTFGEYRRALESIGAEIRTVQLQTQDHFRLPPVSYGSDVVIVTNPNNPTGAYTPPEEMTEWISHIDPTTHVFLDEAFVEFTAQASLVRSIERFPNLWILRSMTKFYAIPGLRLGYLVGSGVHALQAQREPWQVNSLAETAGIASLEDSPYEETTLQLVQRERIWLWKQFQKIPNIHVFPSGSNFFLARCEDDETLDRLIAGLMEKNILIRDCRGVEGLYGPYFRFAIKGREENTRLLDELKNLRKLG
jgi:threonine-phosphate decarboxylase